MHSGFFYWCPEWDSNPQALTAEDFKSSVYTIPPSGRFGNTYITKVNYLCNISGIDPCESVVSSNRSEIRSRLRSPESSLNRNHAG